MIFENAKLNQLLAKLAKKARENSELVLVVGGAVRDKILADEKEIPDIDLIYSGNAIEFIETIKIELGIEIKESFAEFYTLKISHPELENHEIEIASAREEYYPSGAAFPKVRLIESNNAIEKISRDLVRRDFRINALVAALDEDSALALEAASIDKKDFSGFKVFDLCGAFEDLEKEEIKVFHDKSFIDDPTRIVRAQRFAKKTGFKIEAKTASLLEEAKSHPDWDKWYKKRKNRFALEENLLAQTNPAI